MNFQAFALRDNMSVRKGCFVCEKMTFLVTFLLWDKLLHLIE